MEIDFESELSFKMEVVAPLLVLLITPCSRSECPWRITFQNLEALQVHPTSKKSPLGKMPSFGHKLLGFSRRH
jgi:hypothetical protein